MGMDDHHHQPMWPLVQGAANYAWNIIEEVWGMIWKSIETPQEHNRINREEAQTVRIEGEEMRQAGHTTLNFDGSFGAKENKQGG